MYTISNMEPENQETNWTYNPQVETPAQQEQPQVAKKTESISWSASEYISHEKSPMWFAYLASGATVLCAVVFFATRDWIAVTVVGISVLLLGIYANRKPQTRTYKLDSLGLHIDDQLHPYSKFKSFSVVEEGAIRSIWFKPLKRISPVVVVYCAPEEESKIIETLSIYLPHEQRELDQIDRISKQLRF